MSLYRRKLMQFQQLRKKYISYPGLIAAWSAKGKSNEDAGRAVLRDLTGNGHDITLNGFAFSEMSGYGGYKKQFNILNIPYQYCELINRQTIRIYKRTYAGANGNRFDSMKPTDGVRTIKLKVSGITEENKQNNTRVYISVINTDGDNWETYDNGIFEVSYKSTYAAGSPVCIQCYGKTDDNINITVEILPEYPDALVFDGVDDYGVNETKPILSDYTIIYERELFDSRKGNQNTIRDGKAKDTNLGTWTFAVEKYWISFAAVSKTNYNYKFINK